MSAVLERLSALPRLGVGISAEYESALKGIDPSEFDASWPGLIRFVEYGGDLERGLDDAIRRWAAAGRPATYHFLDLNLEESEDLHPGWARRTAALAREIGAPWICGDGGLWHFGRRERGHGLLLPPILSPDSAREMAETVARLEELTGLPVLPENPPAPFFLGEMHVLDYFARVSEEAGCGLLLDCAHLAIFQASRSLPPLTGLDGFPLERVVELHVAGGTPAEHQGFRYVDDTHAPEPIPETWRIVEHVVPRCPNLRAIVYECERNPPEACLENFRRLNALFPAS